MSGRVGAPFVFLRRAQFEALLEYSTSLPTGKTIGKQWKANRNWRGPEPDWWRGEYVEDSDPEYVSIEWRRILL